MLLPFEFLFPRGFFAADILVVFSPHLLLEILDWCELLKNFWWKRFGTLLWRFVIQTVYVRTDNWIMASVTERKYFMDWLFFLWIWLLELTLILLETVLCGSRTFAQDFVSSLFQSKACHLESIYGTDQNCTWELGLNTLEASCGEFVFVIKDLAGGFYLASKPGTFVRNCFCEVLGTICRDFVLNFYAIKGFCRGFCFSWLTAFHVNDFDLVTSDRRWLYDLWFRDKEL